jgi:hypothetical protein
MGRGAQDRLGAPAFAERPVGQLRRASWARRDSVFCILYSVFCILYSVFCILYSVFCILSLPSQSADIYDERPWRVGRRVPMSINKKSIVSMMLQELRDILASAKDTG